MKEVFKAGQLVPKRLGIATVKSKHRHCFTFATDCEVDGKTITMLTPYYYLFKLDDFYNKHGHRIDVEVELKGLLFRIAEGSTVVKVSNSGFKNFLLHKSTGEVV